MMRGFRAGIATAAVLAYLAAAGVRVTGGQAPSPPAPEPPRTQSAGTAVAPAGVKTGATPQSAVVVQFCLGCHNDRAKQGGLVLSGLDLNAPANAEIAEKVVRKLRGGLMPPAGMKRPDSQTVATFIPRREKEKDAGKTGPGAGGG